MRERELDQIEIASWRTMLSSNPLKESKKCQEIWNLYFKKYSFGDFLDAAVEQG